jgi:cobalt/nickel transport system permease protein
MHIPDGYLGPITYGALWIVMVPLWIIASRKLQRDLDTRNVPLLAMGAAFAFVIMMFNVPIPGGSTGHAIGGGLIAILLGPWAGMVAVTIALALQALFFGDGGITALAANSFNMAVVMPLVAYYTYTLIAGATDPASSRRPLAAGIAGYAGLNASAFFTALEFGIQPYLHHTASGQALYSPYPLSVALPVMMSQHLIFFGWIEFAVTFLVIKYLQGADISLLAGAAARAPTINKLWYALALLAILAPLGLAADFMGLGEKGAWGEWGSHELEAQGEYQGDYVPEGMAKLEGLWKTPVPDYSVEGAETPTGSSLFYILSAILGMGAAIFIIMGTHKVLSQRG